MSFQHLEGKSSLHSVVKKKSIHNFSHLYFQHMYSAQFCFRFFFQQLKVDGLTLSTHTHTHYMYVHTHINTYIYTQHTHNIHIKRLWTSICIVHIKEHNSYIKIFRT